MKPALLLFALLAAVICVADESPQAADQRQQAMTMAIIRQQRDQNAQALQEAQVQLQLANAKIAELTRELAATKARLSAMEKPSAVAKTTNE